MTEKTFLGEDIVQYIDKAILIFCSTEYRFVSDVISTGIAVVI